jgi:membrane associated rhomboid family serine protease
MKEIESESRFVWRQIFFLLKLPITIIQIIFGSKKWSEVLRPFRELFAFLFQPKITIFLILVNVAVFILEIFYFTQEQIMNLAFKPSDLLQFNYIPIVSSWFLHASLAHLLGNMLFLYVFGRIVEKDFGFKMLLIYFGSAVISDLVSALAGQGGIGASGAIAGLISVGILMHPFYSTYLIFGAPLPIIIIGWLAIISDVTGVLIPKNDNIGHFAHLGGYFAISLLVFLFNPKQKQKMKIGLIINVLFVIAVAVYWFYFR